MKRLFKNQNRNRLKVIAMVAILLMSTMLFACDQNDSDSEQVELDEMKTQIYYVDTNDTKIIGEEYKPIGTTIDELVEEYLEALNTDPKSFSLKKAKPDNLIVEEYDFNEDGRLTLYFNSGYNDLTGISEVLCRAAIVKTLNQIEGVESIEFYVSGQPLMGSNEKPIGLMESKDFIDNSGPEDVFVTVYFSNEKGTALVDSNLKITYDGNVSIEQLVIECLISGPIEEGMLQTVPEGTELIKVSTKDGICYVDFNGHFLDKMSGIKDEVVIYSVVNSLVEISTINKVQFTIDGVAKKNYSEDIVFDNLFQINLDIFEENK